MVRPNVGRRKVSIDDFTSVGDDRFVEPKEIDTGGQEVVSSEPAQVKNKKRTVGIPSDKDKEPKLNQPKISKGPIVALCVAILLLLGVVAFFVGTKMVNQQPTPVEESTEMSDGNISANTESTLQAPKANEGVTIGMNDIENGTANSNDAEIEEDRMVTDLDGISVIPNYTVGEITEVTDLVNYTKHRAVTDNGMELLWLDIQYKGKEYRATVPFKIFKELDPEGITVVNMEVLNLDNGSQIISHMEVREDYKEKLEEGLR